MAPVLEENKNLRASVDDLQVLLLRECHHKEDLEVKVQALEEERQQMEAEGQSMAKQPGHSADREKGLAQNFAFLLFSVVTCLSVVRSIGDGAWPIPGSHQPASRGKGESEGEG